MNTNIIDNENIHLEDLDEIDSLARYIPHRLTPFQIKVLDNQLYSVKSTMWNMTAFYRFDNDIDIKRLKRAIQKAFKNHPSLSTRIYFDDDGNFMQQYAPGFLERLNIEMVTEEEFAEISKNLVVPFTVLNSPLARVRLFKTPEHTYWFNDVHHLVIDGASAEILFRDVMAAYEDINTELPKDYYYANLWQNYKKAKTPEYIEAKEYFENAYGDTEWYNIPAPDFDTRENIAGIYKLPLGINTDEIKAAERRCRTTRARIANGACLLTLHKYSGENNVLMTWIFNNRAKALRKDAVGLLIKELPIAARINELHTVEDLYKSINLQMKKTVAYDYYDYMLFGEAAFANDSIEVNYLSGTLDVENEGEIDFANHKTTLLEIERNWDQAEARWEMDIFEIASEAEGVKDLLLSIKYMASIYKPETVEAFSLMYREILGKLVRAEKTDSISALLAD